MHRHAGLWFLMVLLTGAYSLGARQDAPRRTAIPTPVDPDAPAPEPRTRVDAVVRFRPGTGKPPRVLRYETKETVVAEPAFNMVGLLALPNPEVLGSDALLRLQGATFRDVGVWIGGELPPWRDQ